MTTPMTIFLRATLLCLVPALLPNLALADELRLDDGRVLVGKIIEKQDIFEVHTRDGIVIVPVTKVVRRFTDAELRQRLAKTRKGMTSTPFAYLRLAIDAHSYGLIPEMWQHLDTTLKKQAGQARKQAASKTVDRRMREFMAGLEPEILPARWRSADTATRVSKLLAQIKIAGKPSRTLAVKELLAREPNAETALRREARRNVQRLRRVAALETLAHRAQGQQDPIRFVLRTTILDPEDDVRAAAARIVREHDQASAAAVDYLAAGLVHDNAKVRIRTAEAFAALGNAAAIEPLVTAGPAAGTARASMGSTGTRAHVAFLNQQAYIRDFDVEVAQASFIADPKVDVLQSGSVLDVNVAGVFEQRVIVRAYRRALKKLAGDDPGIDPKKWADWHRERLAEQPAAATPSRK